jgi:flavin reductase (DIM6/NTAB) family NADH-FMN oxidoreductase RutF
MSVANDVFRDVFRQWASGVAVVTSCIRTGGEEILQGMVISSFCSLSADPPRVMFSASHSARTYDVVAESSIYAVSILSEAQGRIFERFAGLDPVYDKDRFNGLATIEAATGAPIFPDALAWVDCRVVERYPGETYTIFVGEVVDAGLGSSVTSRPLLYFRRAPRQLAATAPV